MFFDRLPQLSPLPQALLVVAQGVGESLRCLFTAHAACAAQAQCLQRSQFSLDLKIGHAGAQRRFDPSQLGVQVDQIFLSGAVVSEFLVKGIQSILLRHDLRRSRAVRQLLFQPLDQGSEGLHLGARLPGAIARHPRPCNKVAGDLRDGRQCLQRPHLFVQLPDAGQGILTPLNPSQFELPVADLILKAAFHLIALL